VSDKSAPKRTVVVLLAELLEVFESVSLLVTEALEVYVPLVGAVILTTILMVSFAAKLPMLHIS
jgi:hypothetical protein